MADIGSTQLKQLLDTAAQNATDKGLSQTDVVGKIRTMQGKKPSIPTIDASKIGDAATFKAPTTNKSKSDSALAKISTTQPDTQAQTPSFDDFVSETMKNVPEDQRDIFSQFISQDSFGGAFGQTYKDIVEKQLNAQVKQSERQKTSLKLQEQAGLPELASQLTAIQGQYETQEAARNSRLVNETGASAGLLTKQQQSTRVSEIQRQYGLQVADNRIDELATSGRINAAKDLIDTKLDLKYGDLEAEIDLYKSQVEAITPFLNAEMAQVAEQRQFAMTQLTNQINTQRQQEADLALAKATAVKNAVDRGANAQQIAQIQDAADMTQLAATGFTTSALEQAELETERLSQANILSQIAQRDSETRETISKINQIGVSMKELGLVNDINLFLESGKVGSVFGVMNTVGRNIPGTPAYTGKAELEQIKNQLALAARGELKGQGTVSDFEGKMLANAQTSLRLNMSPEDADKELRQVRGAIRTSSGLTAPVLVTNPNTGESAILEADQMGISGAIEDGFLVEYQ